MVLVVPIVVALVALVTVIAVVPVGAVRAVVDVVVTDYNNYRNYSHYISYSNYSNEQIQGPRVVVDGMSTKFVDINRGVPQGTVLDPVLFSIIVNDIMAANPNKNLLVKYADGITLSVRRFNSPDLSLVEVQNIQRSSTGNRMTLNLKKMWEKVVRATTKKPLPEPMRDIERKGELKLSGVTFKEQPCNWDTNFDHMITKAISRLYILNKTDTLYRS